MQFGDTSIASTPRANEAETVAEIS
jgi:ammonium transporter Rh